MKRWVLDFISGFHEVGPFVWILHDRGLTLCWRRVVFWEWTVGAAEAKSEKPR